MNYRHALRGSFLTALAALFLISAVGTAISASELVSPTVDREASEAAFLRAYDHFINNRMWECIRELNASLSENIYFVDAYYMRSLAYRRLGRYPEAISEMSYYLEVRQEDPRAGTILRTMLAEWDEIRRASGYGGISLQYRYSSDTLHSFFGIPITSMISLRWMHGVGKMSFDGRSILLCDTFGDRIWAFSPKNERDPLAIDIPAPVACAPSTPTTSLAFSKSGDVYMIMFDTKELSFDIEPLGIVDADVSDAEFIDTSLVAVSDQLGGAVKFISLLDMTTTLSWTPQDSEKTAKLFEPTSIAVYASYLAVADRGNERVFILDANDLSVRARFDISSPRDLQWGAGGELFVLSESGELFVKKIFPSVSDEISRSTSDMKDAWCFTMTDEGPLVCDVVGRTWWQGRINPGHVETVGCLSLHSPWLEDRIDTETLMVRAHVSSVYQNFIQNRMPETQAIWRGETRPSQVVEISTPYGETPRAYSPSPESAASDMKVIRASDIKGVMADLAAISNRGDALPKVLVLDTRIGGTDEDISLFTAFLMQQGIRVDLWAMSRPPSISMQTISKLTAGCMYFSKDLRGVLPNSNCEWVLSIPLPPDTYTFGYPSESTLSIFAGVDVVNFTDWLPIWPALLKK